MPGARTGPTIAKISRYLREEYANSFRKITGCWIKSAPMPFHFFVSHPLKHTHTHIRLMALCPGLPGWAGTRKVKPIWILLKQETVSGSGICWAICKSAPCSRQITIVQFFTGRVPFLPPNQQRQSTEGRSAQPLKMPIKNLQPKSLCSAPFFH